MDVFSAARPSNTLMGERLLRAAARVHEHPPLVEHGVNVAT
jgi:hypothetical protein